MTAKAARRRARRDRRAARRPGPAVVTEQTGRPRPRRGAGRWLGHLLGTPFGLAALGCLVLAGWALFSGGILDGPVARQVRTSSVYAAPEVELDQAAAERIIGNRRLVVVILAPGADLRDACGSVERAAAGTVVLVLSRDGDEYDSYACALIPDRDDENFGRALVAETTIRQGIDGFVDRPLDALKVVTVNYDLLVKAGTIPDGARSISPSLPRYLIAAAAIAAVVGGSVLLYVTGRRAGRLAATHRGIRDATADSRSALSAAVAVLAQQIIDLDQRYVRSVRSDGGNQESDGGQRAFGPRYLRLTADYTALLDSIAATDDRTDVDVDRLTEQVESLSEQARQLAGTPTPPPFG